MFVGSLLTSNSSKRSTPTAVSGTVTDFVLTSAVGGSNLPFVIGQGFKQGDVPSGTTVGGNGSALQVSPRTYWPDNSLRFAIVAGQRTLSAATPLTVDLVNSGTTSGGANLTTTDLKTTGITASIDYGAYGTVSWATTDWDTPFQTSVSGPILSVWRYRKPIGADNHLVGWLEVRLFINGAVEVMAWIENGYLKKTSPGSRSGTATFTLGGSSRYSASLTLLHHQRAVLASGTTFTHWLSTDPEMTPKHNATYLKSTKLVPNYFGVTGSSSTLLTTDLVSSYTPLAQSNYHDPWYDTGYQPHIGLLPQWDAAYITSSGDIRAYRSVMVNALCAGRYGHHYRDETTNLPLKFSDHATLVANSSDINAPGASTTSNYTPTPSGTAPPTWDGPHHPSIGYFAHLISGWDYFLEECQFVATMNYLRNSDGGPYANRDGSKGIMRSEAGANIPRGFAWSLRSLGQALAITPSGTDTHTEFQTSLNENIQYYWNRYVNTSSNPLGCVEPYDHYNTSVAGDPWEHSAFMYDFCIMAIGYLKELQVEGSTYTSKLNAFANWQYNAVVGRFGDGTTGTYNYRYAEAYYTVYIAPRNDANYISGAGGWYSDWGAVATAMSVPAANGGTSLQGTSGGDPSVMDTGYWGNVHPALSYAVDHGYTGASAAWSRLIGASNYSTGAARFNDNPVWGIKPRTV